MSSDQADRNGRLLASGITRSFGKTFFDQFGEQPRHERARRLGHDDSAYLSVGPKVRDDHLKSFAIGVRLERVGQDREQRRNALLKEVFDVFEVLVERRPPDVGVFDDIANGQAIVTAFEDEVAKGDEQRLSRAIDSPIWFARARY